MKIAALLLVAACGSSSSPDAALPALHELRSKTNVDVSYDHTNVSVQTTFETATLPPGLTVSLTVRGMTTRARPPIGTTFVTPVPLSGGPVEDEAVSVTMSLGDEVATASATLPAVITIGQETGTGINPPFTVTWSPTRSDPMHWEFTAGAPSNHTCSGHPPTDPSVFPDTGTLTISSPFGASGGNGCYCNLTLFRTRAGTVAGDAASGSTITASQNAVVYPY